MNLTEHDLRAIERIWGELSEFPAWQSDAALRHAMGEVAALVGATNAFWVAANRPDRHELGLRPWTVVRLEQLHVTAPRVVAAEQQSRRFADGTMDQLTRALLEGAGATRVVLSADHLDMHEWQRGWMYNEFWRPLGIGDRLVGAHTVDPFNESYIGLERDAGSKPFGERERDVHRLFLGGAQIFHRRLLDVEAWPQRLTPRERDVLKLLLTERSEREISDALFLTPSTVHQYVVVILRKFGVSGRIGLMARFLGKGL